MKLVSFKLEWLRSVFSSLIKKLNKLKKQKKHFLEMVRNKGWTENE